MKVILWLSFVGILSLMIGSELQCAIYLRKALAEVIVLRNFSIL